MILSFDTSLPLLSVALLRGETILGALALVGKDSRNEKLLPAVDWLLAQTRVEKEQLELIVVTRGPGSFTGVRVGLATAQGLALALGRTICAMSTHEAIAFAVSEQGRRLVVDDAGRGDFYVSAFEGEEETIPPTLVANDRLSAIAAEFEEVIEVKRALDRVNVALVAATRARELARTERLDRYRDTTPLYVRLAEAEVKLQQRRG